MALSEFILIEEDYLDFIVNLIGTGSRIWYIIANSMEVRNLTIDNIGDLTLAENVSLLMKHPTFATDEPKVVKFEKGDLKWSMFVELEGDGHIKAKSRKFFAFEKTCFYVTFGYTTFFIRNNGEHIGAPGGLIAMYKRSINAAKKNTTRESIGKRHMYLSNYIYREKIDFMDELKRSSAII